VNVVPVSGFLGEPKKKKKKNNRKKAHPTQPKGFFVLKFWRPKVKPHGLKKKKKKKVKKHIHRKKLNLRTRYGVGDKTAFPTLVGHDFSGGIAGGGENLPTHLGPAVRNKGLFSTPYKGKVRAKEKKTYGGERGYYLTRNSSPGQDDKGPRQTPSNAEQGTFGLLNQKGHQSKNSRKTKHQDHVGVKWLVEIKYALKFQKPRGSHTTGQGGFRREGEAKCWVGGR